MFFNLIYREISRDDYRGDYYPTYCSGMIYIMSPQNIFNILRMFEKNLRNHYVWMEDVYFTGILASKLGIQHSNIRSIAYWEREVDNSSDFLISHLSSLDHDQRFTLWKNLFLFNAH